MRAHSTAVALAGLACWVAAGVILAVLHTTIARHHETWWYETVAVGVVLGVYGVFATRGR